MSDKGRVSAGAKPGVDSTLGGLVGAGALSALLFSASRFLPALALVAFVSPLPLAVQRLRAGAANACLAAVLAAALVAAASSPGLGLDYLIALAVPGLLLGESLARGRGLVRGCGWAFTLLMVEIAIALLFAGDAMARATLAPFDRIASEEFLAGLRAGGLNAESVSEIAEQAKSMRELVAVVFPAVWAIAAAVVVIANAALLRLYLLRRDPAWLEEGEFERVRFPLALVAVFVLSGAAVALPLARPAAYNVLLVVGFFFALQGLAVVAFYARRLAAPTILRIALLLLVLANPWAPQILALLGLFDNWFDFRRFAEPPPAEG